MKERLLCYQFLSVKGHPCGFRDSAFGHSCPFCISTCDLRIKVHSVELENISSRESKDDAFSVR